MNIVLILLCERTLTYDDIENCEKDYIIENNITVIGENCFYKCRYVLESISFQDNPQLEVIDKYAFSDCYRFAYLNLSTCVNLRVIGSAAFVHCSNLKTILFPPNIEEIGGSSFSNTKINELDLSHATQLKIISSSAFSYCSELSGLFLPERLKIISDYAFRSNSKLISFELPSTITHIYIGMLFLVVSVC